MSGNTDVDSEWDFSDPELHPQGPYDKWWKDTIAKRIKYKFVREVWDKDITEIAALKRFVIGDYDLVSTPITQEDRDVLYRIGEAGVETLMQLLDTVDTLEKAKQFCETAGITADELKSFLRKVHRYLPFGAQMRQLVAKEDTEYQSYVDRLVSAKLGHSLALLEIGRTREGRQRISKDIGTPEPAFLDLAKRAELTCLHVMGGGMIRQFWAIGYRGLTELRQANLDEYYARCQEYYARHYKGMPYDFTINGARDLITRMKRVPDLIKE